MDNPSQQQIAYLNNALEQDLLVPAFAEIFGYNDVSDRTIVVELQLKIISVIVNYKHAGFVLASGVAHVANGGWRYLNYRMQRGFKNSKMNLHHTRGNTPEHLTSDKAHPRG